jgi:hypothetical protein
MWENKSKQCYLMVDIKHLAVQSGQENDFKYGLS